MRDKDSGSNSNKYKGIKAALGMNNIKNTVGATNNSSNANKDL